MRWSLSDWLNCGSSHDRRRDSLGAVDRDRSRCDKETLMAPLIDLIGRKFGRWTVLEYIGPTMRGHHAKWLCRCRCGNERLVCSQNLRMGVTQSCGCYRRDRTRALASKLAKARNKRRKQNYEGTCGLPCQIGQDHT